MSFLDEKLSFICNFSPNRIIARYNFVRYLIQTPATFRCFI